MRIGGIIECRRLQPLLASYVDRETSVEEKARVERHVAGCRACSRALREQHAVRELLRSHAVEMRVIGMTPPRSQQTDMWGLGRAVPFALAGGVVVVMALMLVTSGSDSVGRRFSALTAVGVINDSNCKTVRADDPVCVRVCVEQRGAKYVFVSKGVVYPIANQSFEGLPRFAARRVQLAGAVDAKGVTVTRLVSVNQR